MGETIGVGFLVSDALVLFVVGVLVATLGFLAGRLYPPVNRR